MKPAVVPFKRYTCLLTFILLSATSHSQIEQGQWLIGGNADFSFSQAKEYNRTNKVTELNISPAVGYFFFNKFAGGLRSGLGVENYKSIPGNRYRTTSISVGPLLRYYFLATDKILNLFAEAAYGYAWSKYTQFDGIYDDSYHSHLLSFKAGPVIFFNEHTALEITLGYNYSTRGPIDTFKTNSIRLGIGLQIHLDRLRKRNE